MSLILMTTLFYKALMLQGEIWCWSLLGLPGLRASWLYRLFFYLLTETLGLNARVFAIYSFIFSISACKLNEKNKIN